MASTKNIPATDSPTDLRPLVGDDATATFEADPSFTGSAPEGSSENLRSARRGDEELDPMEVEDDDDGLDEDDELEDDDDLDEDEEDEDDELEEEDDEDDDEDDDDDEDEEDDEDEVGALSARSGEDDDAGDIAAGVSEDEFTEDDMDTDRVTQLPYAA